MREIKFRAWDTEKKEWVKMESEVDDAGERAFVWDLILAHNDGKLCLINDVYPAEISQFTGLYDKTGKEIWEGDICSFASHMRGVKPFVIRWDSMFDFSNYSPKDKVEVIGNIYQDSHLLDKHE